MRERLNRPFQTNRSDDTEPEIGIERKNYTVLLFLNARPVVSDERSEEFRRSVKESLNGPFQANRSDGIKPGIGIERKNKPTFISVNMYITVKI